MSVLFTSWDPANVWRCVWAGGERPGL